MLKLWNADTGKEVKSLGGHTGSITSVFLLPKRDISSCGERVVLIFLCLCFCLCLSIYFSLKDLFLERIPLTTMFNPLFVLQPLWSGSFERRHSLWRRVYPRNVSLGNCILSNQLLKTNLSCNIPTDAALQFRFFFFRKWSPFSSFAMSICRSVSVGQKVFLSVICPSFFLPVFSLLLYLPHILPVLFDFPV